MTQTSLPLDRLPPAVRELLRLAGEASEATRVRACAVGGLVRDLLLCRPAVHLHDVDIVAEGRVSVFARALCERLGGTLTGPSAFLTYRIEYCDTAGKPCTLDVVTARRESYPVPACLPEVVPAAIEDDLARRDFTVNAMAVLLPAKPDSPLLDPLNGQKDLAARRLRVLHPASFRDDPTRMFRAVRFETRCAFHLGREDEAYLARALVHLDAVSGTRIRHELELTAEEDAPADVLVRLNRLGILAAVHPSLVVTEEKESFFLHLETEAHAFADVLNGPRSRFLLLLAGLAGDLPPSAHKGLAKRLRLDAHAADMLAQCARLAGMQEKLAASTACANGDFFERVSPFSPEALVWLAASPAGEKAKSLIERHLREWRLLPPLLDGFELQQMGMPPGPSLGTLLHRIRIAQINGVIRTRQEAARFAQENIRFRGPSKAD